jgi:hypothetical protein
MVRAFARVGDAMGGSAREVSEAADEVRGWLVPIDNLLAAGCKVTAPALPDPEPGAPAGTDAEPG